MREVCDNMADLRLTVLDESIMVCTVDLKSLALPGLCHGAA